MPIRRCFRKGIQGWKWGHQRCYTGKNAKRKAQKQAQAIYASGYTGNEVEKFSPNASAVHALRKHARPSPLDKVVDLSALTPQELQEGVTLRSLLGNASYFAECARDERGRCLPRGGEPKTERQRYYREARTAGVNPAEMFQMAGEMRGAEREHITLVTKMLKEARQAFVSESGKKLTRNHPAFHGGDHASIKGFDAVARTMAGRYPELLGAHGYEHDSGESASAKLFDYLSAGTPKPRPRSHWYAQSLEYLYERNRRRNAEVVPF